jgi:putative serine protease PepD
MLVLVAIVAVVVGAGSTAITYALVNHQNSTAAAGAGLASSAQSTPAVKPDGTVSAAASAISPSVVTVTVAAGSQGGTGSGIVIRADGYILTNNHVATLDSSTQAAANQISVTLADGSTTPATVVGTDSGDDLAVVKVGATNLTAAVFASSSALTVGQTVWRWVLRWGCPTP